MDKKQVWADVNADIMDAQRKIIAKYMLDERYAKFSTEILNGMLGASAELIGSILAGFPLEMRTEMKDKVFDLIEKRAGQFGAMGGIAQLSDESMENMLDFVKAEQMRRRQQ